MQTVLVLDFGGQYSYLIARRVRELRVFCDVVPGSISSAAVSARAPIGVILSGGPQSVHAPGAPAADPALFALGIPVLGICYGCHLLAAALGGAVAPGAREFGRTQTHFDARCALFRGLPAVSATWMSHSDCVARVPDGFAVTATTAACAAAAIARDRLFGVQFHPEVEHTESGREVLRRFLYDVCGAAGDWTMGNFRSRAVASLRARVGSGRALLALSGGVDSAVAAALAAEALGARLTCVFVDHGLLRAGEGDAVAAAFAGRGLRLVRVDAAARFFGALAGIDEPEAKRRAVGAEFARVFEEEARALGGAEFLVQGTISADVIESGAGGGAVIKSHHNVGGLPPGVGFRGVVEPLRELFKDEVRELGRALGLPEAVVARQPFPGPGLAIRVVGAVTRERVDAVRAADAVFAEEIERAGIAGSVSQFFAVLTPVRSVGVMGDGRTYESAVVLRAVRTSDFMTAECAKVPFEVLERAAVRIVNEVGGVNRVCFDLTSKPPATIEWE